jgi:hypothetical protein
MGYEYQFKREGKAELARAMSEARSFAAQLLGNAQWQNGIESYPLTPSDPGARPGWLQFVPSHILLSVSSRKDLGSPLVARLLAEFARLGLEAYEEGDPTPTTYSAIG